MEVKMKTIDKVSRFVSATIFSVALLIGSTACESDTITNSQGKLPNEGSIDNISGVLRSGKSAINRVVLRLDEGNFNTSDKIYYKLTQPSASDVKVTATADFSLVDKYNTDNGTSLTPLPTENFTLAGGGVITVKAGEYFSERIDVTLKSDNLEPKVYLLPLVISEATGDDVSTPASERTLYYLFNVRTLDLSNMPLDDAFISVFYLDTQLYQPLLADMYALIKMDPWTGEEINTQTIGNIVNLRTVQIGYDAVSKRAKLQLNPDMRYVLEHTDKYIRPLQDKGRKVCICIEGAGMGIGFCNLTDAQIADFVTQVDGVVSLYKLDGINLWDRNSGYGKEGMPAMNTTSYPKLIKALRTAMPDKMITLADCDESTESFYDTNLTGGIAVGDYIDYAWSGYMTEEEPDFQVVDPWYEGNPYSIHSRKPISNLDPSKYGCLSIPFYKNSHPAFANGEGVMNIASWKLEGRRQSNILVLYDIITLLQGEYESQIGMTFDNILMSYDCLLDWDFNIDHSYGYVWREPIAPGYNHYTKDW